LKCFFETEEELNTQVYLNTSILKSNNGPISVYEGGALGSKSLDDE